MNSLLIIFGIGLVVLGLVSFGIGIYFLIRYARMRKRSFLVIGLILTFIVPGLVCCLAFMLWLPSATVVYGPPPLRTP